MMDPEPPVPMTIGEFDTLFDLLLKLRSWYTPGGVDSGWATIVETQRLVEIEVRSQLGESVWQVFSDRHHGG